MGWKQMETNLNCYLSNGKKSHHPMVRIVRILSSVNEQYMVEPTRSNYCICTCVHCTITIHYVPRVAQSSKKCISTTTIIHQIIASQSQLSWLGHGCVSERTCSGLHCSWGKKKAFTKEMGAYMQEHISQQAQNFIHKAYR